MTHADAIQRPPAPAPAPSPADLVVESLLYDTTIYVFNLFIVFQDRNVGDMIVDVLALEFFTTIDDEFKGAVLKYESAFLDDMVTEAIEDGCYAGSACSLEDGGREADAVRVSTKGGGGEEEEEEGKGACAAAVTKVVVPPLEAVLHGIRAFCRIAGPFFSCVMIVYGPYCLGTPEG